MTMFLTIYNKHSHLRQQRERLRSVGKWRLGLARFTIQRIKNRFKIPIFFDFHVNHESTIRQNEQILLLKGLIQNPDFQVNCESTIRKYYWIATALVFFIFILEIFLEITIHNTQ